MPMKKVTIAYLGVWLLVCTTAACFAQKVQRAPGVQVSVQNLVVPLMKGLAHNPVMRVRIYVPEGQQLSTRTVQLQLDRPALAAIEKLEVLARNEKQRGFWDSAQLVSTVTPSAATLHLPLPADLKAGLHTYWVSAALKPSADIDKKVSLRAVSLTAGNGKVFTVTNTSDQIGEAPVYTRRLGVVVRKAWDDSVHTYRIPGMVTTDRGTLIAVYDIRYNHSGDLPANIDVGMSRSTDGGRTWEPMKIIMDMGPPHENNGVGDPAVLFDLVTRKLWVAALWSKGNRSIAGSMPGLSPDTTGQFVLTSSDDDGRTWSAPYSITNQVKNPAWHLYFNGPGNGITMHNGTLVFPSQYWDESKKPGIPHSSIVYSEDHGKTWKSGIGAKSNTTESQVVETTPGTLMLNMRDNRGRFRSVATTTDMGKTWVEHPTSQEALPDPVCMASFIKAHLQLKGRPADVLFFSNVATQAGRQNTTIKASLDLGESWKEQNQVLLDSRRNFGYSALTKIDDRTIGILYEGERDLYFLRVPVEEIIQ
jgi:sialidase-1